MEFEEWKILVKGLKSAYTSVNFLPDMDSVKTWYQLLKDMEYRTLNTAIMQWISTERFPPTIADLRKTAVSVVMPEQLEWSEGWKEAKKAISRYGYYNQLDGLNSLSPAVRQCVERIGWNNLCMMEFDEEMAVRAQFRDMYNAVMDREKQRLLLSPKISELIGTIRREALPGE